MSLMLINPRKRGTKKRRTAAQRAATARMVAANRGLATNPKRRRSPKRATARRRNPIGISRVSRPARRAARRRNPISLRGGAIGDLVFAGIKGAVGGIAVNAVTSFLPATFKTGNVLYVTRAAIAILIGTVGSKFVGKHARAAAEGAMAINMADFINTFAAGKLPGSTLHGVGGMYMGEYLSGVHTPNQLPGATSEYMSNMGVGMYQEVPNY